MAKSAMPLLVRPAEEVDSGAIALSHVRSWQEGYAGVISREYLRSLDLELPNRTARWQTLILGAGAEARFVLVGEMDGEVAGWISGGPYRDPSPDEPPLADRASLGEVYGCYVDPAHWREGVGSALMAAALGRLAGAGFEEAALWVLEENPRARAFYERHGWLADGARKFFDVAGGHYPEIRYRRPL